MEKVKWNSIDKKQTGLKKSKNEKITHHPRAMGINWTNSTCCTMIVCSVK